MNGPPTVLSITLLMKPIEHVNENGNNPRIFPAILFYFILLDEKKISMVIYEVHEIKKKYEKNKLNPSYNIIEHVTS